MYNGWTNYETWNAALWINNDYALYDLARESEDFEDFVYSVRQLFGDHTPDGVAWNDRRINSEELDKMFHEYHTDD